MNEDEYGKAITELAKINYQRTTTTLEKHEYVNIEVKGCTLGECKKCFDNIKKEVDECPSN